MTYLWHGIDDESYTYSFSPCYQYYMCFAVNKQPRAREYVNCIGRRRPRDHLYLMNLMYYSTILSIFLWPFTGTVFMSLRNISMIRSQTIDFNSFSSNSTFFVVTHIRYEFLNNAMVSLSTSNAQWTVQMSQKIIFTEVKSKNTETIVPFTPSTSRR